MLHPSPSKLLEGAKPVQSFQNLAIAFFVVLTVWLLMRLYVGADEPITLFLHILLTIVSSGGCLKLSWDCESDQKRKRQEYEKLFFSKAWTFTEIKEAVMLLEAHIKEFEEVRYDFDYSKALSKGLVDSEPQITHRIEFLKAKLKDPNTRLDQLNTLNREQARQIRLNPELKAQIEGLFNQRKLELLTEDE